MPPDVAVRRPLTVSGPCSSCTTVATQWLFSPRFPQGTKVTRHYVVLLTPTEVRWKVRILPPGSQEPTGMGAVADLFCRLPGTVIADLAVGWRPGRSDSFGRTRLKGTEKAGPSAAGSICRCLHGCNCVALDRLAGWPHLRHGCHWSRD